MFFADYLIKPSLLLLSPGFQMLKHERLCNPMPATYRLNVFKTAFDCGFESLGFGSANRSARDQVLLAL
jgi:hypothetical protein